MHKSGWVLLVALLGVSGGSVASDSAAEAKSVAQGVMGQMNINDPESTAFQAGLNDGRALNKPENQQQVGNLKALKQQGVGIEDTARQRLPESEVGSDFQAAAQSRPKYSFDEENDPMFTRAKAVENNAESLAGLMQSEYSDCVTQTRVITPAPTISASCTEWPEPTSGRCERTYHVTCEAVLIDADFQSPEAPADFPWSFAGGILQLGYNSINYWTGPKTSGRFFEREVIFSVDDKEKIDTFILSNVRWDDYIAVYFNDELVFHSLAGGDILELHHFVCNGSDPWNNRVYSFVRYKSNVGMPECVPDTYAGGEILSFYFYNQIPSGWVRVDAKSGYEKDVEVDLKDKIVSGVNTIKVQLVVADHGDARLKFTALQNSVDCSGSWLSSGQCSYFQEQTEQGFCTAPEGEKCVEGAETRYFSGQPIEQSCWKYATDYQCLMGETTEESQCQQLRDTGCSQTGSECIERLPNGQCISYEQQFECPAGDAVTQDVMVCGEGDQGFCLDGNCADTGYEASTDFAKAASYLSMMDAMGEDFNQNTQTIFNGEVYRCSDQLHANCCKPPGIMICPYENITICNKNPDLLIEASPSNQFCTDPAVHVLFEKRKAGMCRYVGKKCSSDTLGFCTRYRQTHCCFSGKLGRILQEQGRAQLGIGWGSADQPNCRGFTPEEIEQIDWSQLDLSEYFQDALNNFSNPDGGSQAQQLQQRMQELLP